MVSSELQYNLTANCNAKCGYFIGRLISIILYKTGILQFMEEIGKPVYMFAWSLIKFLFIAIGYCLVFLLPLVISISLVSFILGTDQLESNSAKKVSRKEEIIFSGFATVFFCIILKILKSWMNLNENIWHIALYIGFGSFVLFFITVLFQTVNIKCLKRQ